MHTTAPATIHLGSVVLPRLGPVEVAVTDEGVCAVALPRWNDHDLRLAAWQAAGFTARRGDHPVLQQAFGELRAYADGHCLGFTVPLDLRYQAPFTERVLRTLLKVPAGRLTTYGRLAAKAGSPGAARAVGGAVGRNPIPIIIPCHRVVAAGGIGGFGLGLDCKRTLLAIEGVEM
jgi:methylated-DNA-[protein]-cysteine S-methyltransferase